MAERDIELLTAVGMNAAQAASHLSKTRQAVSRGIKSPSRYFDEGDIRTLLAAIGNDAPKHARARTVVNSQFNEFAARLMSSQQASDFDAAFNACSRLWLIFPDLTATMIENRAYWDEFMSKVLARNERDSSTLEITAFFAKEQERYSFVKQFGEHKGKWEAAERLLCVICTEVSEMGTACITDPHDKASSFCMSEFGFVALARADGERWLTATAKKYTKVLKEASKEDDVPADRQKRGLNPLMASVAEVLKFLGRTEREPVVGASS